MSLVMEYGGGSSPPPPTTADILYDDSTFLSSQTSSYEEDSFSQFDDVADKAAAFSSSPSLVTMEDCSLLSGGDLLPTRPTHLGAPLTDSSSVANCFNSSSHASSDINISTGRSKSHHFGSSPSLPQQGLQSSPYALNNFSDSNHSGGEQQHFPAVSNETSRILSRYSCHHRRRSDADHIVHSSHSNVFPLPPTSPVTLDDSSDPSSSGVRLASKAIRRRKRSPPSAAKFDINDNSLQSVYSFIRSFLSASTASTVAIDNKIEQAMDLVKSHLMFAVREEVDVLKEKIGELMERINHLEYENTVLKKYATQDTLQQLQHNAPNP